LKTPIPAASPRPLALSTVLPFSAPALPLAALNVAVFVYLPPYFAGHLKMSMTLIGILWMAVRFIDVPVDLLLAVVMDRTRTPIGRYRAWLIVGAPVLMLALYKLFMAPIGFGGGYLLGWLLVMYLGTSIMTLAQSAWGATLATRYDERSRLFSILAAVGVLGTLGVLAIPSLHEALGLTDAGAVRVMGWTIIAALPLTVLLAAARAPERIAKETAGHRPALKDYWAVITKPDLMRLFLAQMALTLGPGWMAAIYLFFFTAARGFSSGQASLLLILYIAAGIPGALFTAQLSRRIGKHRTLMVTTTAFSLALFSIFVVPKGNLLATAPVMLWCGSMASGFDLMIRAMLADVGDEVRLDQGKERLSLLYAVNTLAAKIAAALAIGFTFPLLEALGYNAAEGVVNKPAAIFHLELAFLLGPIVFVMLGGACVIGWRLDARRHGEIRAELDARDAALATAQEIGPLLRVGEHAGQGLL
jgi:glycoside/pentoside/hexuronide:cation symporter, GPH family